jgi:AraC family transcriptional regulator
MNLEVKMFPAMRLAAVRHSGPYNLIGPVFHRLGDIAGPAGLFTKPGAMMMGIYKDDPGTTAPEELRSAAGVVIAEDAPLPPGLVEERLPGGRFACFTHQGSYEQLGNSWMHVMNELMPSSGYRRRPGTSCEIYLNNPEQVSTPELKTEICVPIE